MLNWTNEDVAIDVQNSGFETAGGGGADVFAGWSEATGGTSSVNAETVDVDSGTTSCRLDIDGSNSIAQISQGFSSKLEVGQSIDLTFRAKSTGGFWLAGPNSEESSFQVGTAWETITLSFTDIQNTTILFKRSSAPNQSLYIDSVEVTITQANAYATTWYDQSGVQVESVFNDTDCSTANGWAQAGNATLTVNYDSGDEGHESVFRLESGDGIAERIQLDDTYTDGTVYRVSFDHRYVTNNATKGRIFVTATQYGDITPSATWTRHELIWTQVGTGTSLRLYIDNNDGDASDEWLFDNIKVEQLDKAHNDATQTTADNQPKVVDAGALVTDANGNYSLDFDGVDDSLVVANLVNEFENTDFQLTAVGSNVYAGLVSGSVPRLYFRDTAYSYDALSIITYTNPSLAIQTWECVGSAHEVFHDGSSVGTATQAQTAFGPTDFAIGQSAAAYRYTNISALLFYPTDQSANREAIEQSLSKILTTALS